MKTIFTAQFILLILLPNILSAQTETKIHKDSLPSTVKEHLHKKYYDYVVAEAVKATDKNGAVIYKVLAKRVRSEQETIVYDLRYDAAGKLISKSKSKIYTFDGTEKKNKPSKGNDGHNHVHPPVPGF